MAYTKTVWSETTPVNATNLNKMEQGIENALDSTTGGTVKGVTVFEKSIDLQHTSSKNTSDIRAKNRISIVNDSSNSQGLNIGSLLVSDVYEDSTKVPANGAYIKGQFDLGTSSKTASGYTDLPNGLILQWGTYTGSGLKPFPKAFPNACLSINITCGSNISSQPPYVAKSSCVGFTKSTFEVITYGYEVVGANGVTVSDAAYQSTVSAKNFGATSRWWAIGY